MEIQKLEQRGNFELSGAVAGTPDHVLAYFFIPRRTPNERAVEDCEHLMVTETVRSAGSAASRERERALTGAVQLQGPPDPFTLSHLKQVADFSLSKTRSSTPNSAFTCGKWQWCRSMFNQQMGRAGRTGLAITTIAAPFG